MLLHMDVRNDWNNTGTPMNHCPVEKWRAVLRKKEGRKEKWNEGKFNTSDNLMYITFKNAVCGIVNNCLKFIIPYLTS